MKYEPILPGEGFVRISQICGDKRRGIPGVLPMAHSTWRAGVASGQYPQPVRHGSMAYWRVDDIRALIQQIAAEGQAA